MYSQLENLYEKQKQPSENYFKLNCFTQLICIIIEIVAEGCENVWR